MKCLIAGLILVLASGCGNTPDNNKPAAAPTPPISAPATKAPDETAAIRIIGDINKAQGDYFKRNRRYALTYEELIESHVLTEEPSKEMTGYEIKMRPAADAASYSLSAIPVSPTPGARHFFTDQTGAIRAEPDKDASAASPKI